MKINSFQFLMLLIISTLLASCSSNSNPPAATIQPTIDPVVKKGEQIFTQNCASCHSKIENIVIVGPPMAGLASRAGQTREKFDARGYIENSILNPEDYIVPGFKNIMPTTFGKVLSGEDLDAVVAFLLTLE